MRRLGLLKLLFFTGLFIGCAQKTSTFSGTITYQGKLITQGVVYFLGPAPDMRMGMGTIQDNGIYIATHVPIGQVRVSFQSGQVPAKYSDPNKSAIVYEITSGMKSLDIIIP